MGPRRENVRRRKRGLPDRAKKMDTPAPSVWLMVLLLNSCMLYKPAIAHVWWTAGHPITFPTIQAPFPDRSCIHEPSTPPLPPIQSLFSPEPLSSLEPFLLNRLRSIRRTAEGFFRYQFAVTLASELIGLELWRRRPVGRWWEECKWIGVRLIWWAAKMALGSFTFPCGDEAWRLRLPWAAARDG